MQKFAFRILLLASVLHLGGDRVWSQVLDNSFLNGRYGVRQVLLSTTVLGSPIDARSWIGILSFDGNGGLSFEGTRNLGNSGPAAYRGSGNYTVQPNGLVRMTNPLEPSATMNARLGNGVLLASTTDSAGNLFDLLIAAPLPFGATSAATVTGTYSGGLLEFPNGLFSNIKNAFFRFTADGRGGAGTVAARGQTVQNGRRLLEQNIAPTTYNVSADGSGTLIFPQVAPLLPADQVLLGDKRFYIGGNGSFLYGGSIQQGAHDIFLAFRTPVEGNDGIFRGQYFAAGTRVALSRPEDFAASVNAIGDGRSVWTRRTRTPEGSRDSATSENYRVDRDGSGVLILRNQESRFAVSEDGNLGMVVGTSVEATDNYELAFLVKTRNLSGSGVFVNPAGVVNGASFAPTGASIAPGQFLTIFGDNLGPETPVVASAPFPTILGGVMATIQNRPAPIYFVSRGQMSVLVPFATSGTQAELVVRNGAQESNRVTLPVARTAPGVYSQSQNGLGAGAILKSDFSLLTPANPARRGDTILIYLTGLGGLEPALPDGAPASTTELSRVTDNVTVFLGGMRATVSFAGAAPGFAGLYQLNVVIPMGSATGTNVPLTIETAASRHEMVSVAIVP